MAKTHHTAGAGTACEGGPQSSKWRVCCCNSPDGAASLLLQTWQQLFHQAAGTGGSPCKDCSAQVLQWCISLCWRPHMCCVGASRLLQLMRLWVAVQPSNAMGHMGPMCTQHTHTHSLAAGVLVATGPTEGGEACIARPHACSDKGASQNTTAAWPLHAHTCNAH